MSDFVYQTHTSDKTESKYDVLGHVMPAKAFFFVTVDEVGPEGFLVRRTYSSVNDPRLPRELTPLQRFQIVYPEMSGLMAPNQQGLAQAAEHVLELDKRIKVETPFVSASSNFPGGAERFHGSENPSKLVYIDIAKAKRSGAIMVTPAEIGRSIDEYVKDMPSKARREADYLKKKALGVDSEFLVKPKPIVPAEGIFTQKGLKIALGVEKWARVVQVFGIFLTAYDLSKATNESIKFKSVKPITKATLRQIAGWEGSIAGRWAGAAIGARMGATTGVLCGIELGPGAIITGAIGGIIGGALAYTGESYLLDQTMGE
ncbi:glycine zipper family protein [Burkholderia sp. Ac-20344]|uniref:glycine zipper family protein n=1 Tax=Burkholderia sp. Ac-20344 TaxID=2703890 RepID=UPI00197B2C49|nr:glycine zipper family protein [Burkholderia sp. Ac-20344]MBN3831984.1 glycine zipper family protein [Burkholderia sp. Ac-20344]